MWIRKECWTGREGGRREEVEGIEGKGGRGQECGGDKLNGKCMKEEEGAGGKG